MYEPREETSLDRELDLEVILGESVASIADALRADRGTLYLIDRPRSELVSRVGLLHGMSEIRLRLGEGVAGWVAAHGETVRVDRGRDDPRFAAQFDAVSGYRTHSLLAAAVRVDGEVVGVVQLLNRRGGPFDAADEARLEAEAEGLGRLLTGTSLRSQLAGHPSQPLSFRFNGIIGASQAMLHTFGLADRAARTEATVLIRGETGTGKDLVARAIHHNSSRWAGPLVKVDCSALPAELIENELFGHERGAFTGADRRAEGKVGAAAGGTLFLDEIGDLPPAVQGKLLRLVQDRAYYRVGGTEPLAADVRFLFATHRDLERLVEQERFRRDLYYRVRVVEIVSPSLRERGHGDLDRLIDHFLFEYGHRHGHPDCRLTASARAALHAHSWPGNVRELQHCIESAVVLGEGTEIEAVGLGPATGGEAAAAGEARFSTGVRPLRDVVRDYCRYVVEHNGGNRSRAARRLDIGRNTLARRLAQRLAR